MFTREIRNLSLLFKTPFCSIIFIFRFIIWFSLQFAFASTELLTEFKCILLDSYKRERFCRCSLLHLRKRFQEKFFVQHRFDRTTELRLEDVQSLPQYHKLPNHIAIIVPSEDVDDRLVTLAHVIHWCIEIGVQQVTLYDIHGNLERKQSELAYLVAFLQLSAIRSRSENAKDSAQVKFTNIASTSILVRSKSHSPLGIYQEFSEIPGVISQTLISEGKCSPLSEYDIPELEKLQPTSAPFLVNILSTQSSIKELISAAYVLGGKDISVPSSPMSSTSVSSSSSSHSTPISPISSPESTGTTRSSSTDSYISPTLIKPFIDSSNASALNNSSFLTSPQMDTSMYHEFQLSFISGEPNSPILRNFILAHSFPHFPISEPQFLLVLSSTHSLFGFAPWLIRLVEIYFCSTYYCNDFQIKDFWHYLAQYDKSIQRCGT